MEYFKASSADTLVVAMSPAAAYYLETGMALSGKRVKLVTGSERLTQHVFPFPSHLSIFLFNLFSPCRIPITNHV